MKMIAAALLVAACHTPPPATPGSNADLEARVLRLEATNAKNAEAMEFLQLAYNQQKQQREDQENNAIDDTGTWAVPIAADVAAGQVEGPKDAPVTIVKAFDFACPYCYRSAATMDALVAKYKGQIRVVYKNLVVHQPALPAHLASCAAAKQGKYIAFKTAFWDKGFAPYMESRDATKLGEDNILAIAKDMKLDIAKFTTDMKSDACKSRVADDMSDLEPFKVDSTPTFFINGTIIAGAMDQSAFETIIDTKLAMVKASGVAAGEYYDKVVLAQGEKTFRNKKTPKH